MKITQALELANTIRPNELGDTVLTTLLTELEGALAVEIRGEHPEALTKPLANGELILPLPFDSVYWTYLVAMIDLAAKDVESYKASNALYSEARDAYAHWYQRIGGRQ